MEYREYNPFPEYLKVEIQTFLPRLIKDRVSGAFVLWDISFKHECEETQPGCEESIVEGGEPICEIDLPWEAIVIGEVELCED